MDTTNLFRLDGRTALITGGSRGIGKMIAAGFIAQGARVYISARTAAACDATAAELSKDGGGCTSIPADISTTEGLTLGPRSPTRRPAGGAAGDTAPRRSRSSRRPCRRP